MSKTRTTMSLTTGTFPIMNGIHYISNDEDITDHSDITEVGSFAKVINDLDTSDDLYFGPVSHYSQHLN